MKIILSSIFLLMILTVLGACDSKVEDKNINIVYLHHSTGRVIWNGKQSSAIAKRILNKSTKVAGFLGIQAELPRLFDNYNTLKKVNYQITEMTFPKASPYGWNNYPYDYYNIWVKHAEEDYYLEEPTLEALSAMYDVIIFKHCFPVSNIEADSDSSNVDSEEKTIGNYKLQYLALKKKLLSFPETKFVLWTPTALVKNATNEEESERANQFYNWVKEEWDRNGDNIYLWDFRQLQTEGGLYFKEEYAQSTNDSHPNQNFANIAVNKLFNRLIDIIENKGQGTSLTGEEIK
nr:hypothetical protein [uncultured Carboxylicivirga sp.]